MSRLYVLLVILIFFFTSSSNAQHQNSGWSAYKTNNQEHIKYIGMPVGGIGSGQVFLGGDGLSHVKFNGQY